MSGVEVGKMRGGIMDEVVASTTSLKKPPLAATQACSLRTQALPIFSNISRLPAHVL